MSTNDNEGSSADRDLLSRLNALKKSTIDLDQKTHGTSLGVRAPSADQLAGRDLHATLLDRFKSLHGNSASPPADSSEPAGAHGTGPHGNKAEEDLTIEELLADLGPSEQWDVPKTEHDEVEGLLRAADVALKERPELETIPDEEAEAQKSAEHQLPAVDVSVFQPEAESEDEDEPKHTKAQLRDGVDKEADGVLKRLMDEVKYEQEHGTATDVTSETGSDDGEEATADRGLDLPAAPSKEVAEIAPESVSADGEEDLAVRFASLSLPSVPTSLKSNPKATQASTTTKFEDEEIDSWCVICNDDAALRCLGCDNDLYCTNCWMEGHRGEDAGYEERTHKAVQYVKGGKKKQKSRRVMLGA